MEIGNWQRSGNGWNALEPWEPLELAAAFDSNLELLNRSHLNLLNGAKRLNVLSDLSPAKALNTANLTLNFWTLNL
jgi:hypothetical protein